MTEPHAAASKNNILSFISLAIYHWKQMINAEWRGNDV